MVAVSMRRQRLFAMLLGLFGFWVCQSAALAEDADVSLRAGKALYEQSCARCHGVDGKGNGPDAKRLFPKPRDLTLGVYKFRSTESGTPPTDADLSRTISRGLPGSAMPTFEELSEAQRMQLVAYLKTLSPTFSEQQPQPVAFASDPGFAHADLAKGKQLYKDLGCVACHGNVGRGNGPSARVLVDDWDHAIRPANLAQGWNYRGGSDAHSVTLRMLTGIDGTGMPSYAGAVSPEDAWHLAYYVTSLQEEPHWKAAVNTVISEGPLPSAVSDPVWETMEKTDVSLGSTFYRDGAIVPTTVNAVSIQAISDEEAIVLRLVWDDPAEDRPAPADALGLVLRPEGIGDEVGSLRMWPLKGSLALDVVYWSSDRNQIREGVAIGFAPVATRQASVETLAGEAVYEDGRWTLLIRRPLVGPPGAVQLTREHPVSIAIAIWDGGNNEQRRHRSSSAWIELRLP